MITINQDQCSSPKSVHSIFVQANLVFFDFDGVIKDSISAKSDAFAELFSGYDPRLAVKVRDHHETHGGMSRFEKLPLYLSWAGVQPTPEKIHECSNQFAQLARAKVLASPWVKGMREYLEREQPQQTRILVTATPEKEIIEILNVLKIRKCFHEVHGAPKKKSDVVQDVLQRWQVSPDKTLLVGDSMTDWQAAMDHQVPFLLRRTPWNRELQESSGCLAFDHL
ncbi:putative phosphatase [Thiorhodovibrio frisius]|uniref:phosphoglycolate phosphatase n=1 Tax=Thiorhodovibrio frisius TaxID=631362 RepID=H8Z0B3_9GAMM|nr:putative phosphatase [Thiorhodovibrio frisius]